MLSANSSNRCNKITEVVPLWLLLLNKASQTSWYEAKTLHNVKYLKKNITSLFQGKLEQNLNSTKKISN